MVIECPSLDACHRENEGLIAQLLLMNLQFGKIERSETGIEMEIEMEVELFDITRLAITQSSELLGIAKEKFDLKAQFVEASNHNSGEQHCQYFPLRLVHNPHLLQQALYNFHSAIDPVLDFVNQHLKRSMGFLVYF